MGTLAQILSTHREELKQQGRRQRLVLVAYIIATFASALLALYIFRGGSLAVPMLDNLLADNQDYALSVVYFFGGAAFGTTLQIWRRRRTRIKTLIAEAFLMENDPDTALRLILELQIGDTAWLNEQLALLATANSSGGLARHA